MYFLRRLLLLIPLLLVISFVAFLLVHATPGGPFDRERRPASPEIERAIKAKFHLDEPVLKQYLRYIGLVWEKDANGNWHHAPASYDVSLRYRNHTVTDVIARDCRSRCHWGFWRLDSRSVSGCRWVYFSAVRRGHWQDYAGSFLRSWLFAYLVWLSPHCSLCSSRLNGGCSP